MNSDIPPLKVETKKTRGEFACHLLRAFYCVTRHSVKHLLNGHLWNRQKWPLQREVLIRVKVWTVRREKSGRCNEVAVVEFWPLVDIQLY